MKRKSNINGTSYRKYCIEIVSTSKKGIMIRKDRLLKLLKKSKQAHKKALLVIQFDDVEAHCEITLRRKNAE